MTHSEAPASGSAANRIWISIALVVVLLGALVQAQFLAFWLARGGNGWAQGDWLINLAAGPVRRGPFGSVLLWLASTTGLSVIAVLGTLQVAMATALYGLFFWLVAIQRHGAAALAVFSAALFVFVVATFPGSGMRKEIFGLVALLLLAVPGGGLGRLTLSSLLVLAGAIGHEVGVLFLPAWFAAIALFQTRQSSTVPGALLIGLTTLAIIAAAIFAIRFSAVTDTTLICEAINAAGQVSSHFCSGAIAWLANPDSPVAQVSRVIGLAGWALVPMLGMAVLSCIPLVRLMQVCNAPRRIAFLLLGAAAPFLLLYPIGFDWGRWVMIQYSIAAIIVLGLMARGELVPRGAIRPAEMAFWLILASAGGLNLSMTLLPFGAIRTLALAFGVGPAL